MLPAKPFSLALKRFDLIDFPMNSQGDFEYYFEKEKKLKQGLLFFSKVVYNVQLLPRTTLTHQFVRFV